jgi:hypothetical protein
MRNPTSVPSLLYSAVLLAACTACTVAEEHLSDNAIDIVFKQRSLTDYSYSSRIRRELFRHVPEESKGVALRVYLESMGAKCVEAETNEISCIYRTYTAMRQSRYFLFWKLSEEEVARTDFDVTIVAGTDAPIGKYLTVVVDAWTKKD